MLSKPMAADLRTARAQSSSEEDRAEDLFNLQKAYFATDATKTYEWRICQLDRLIRMLQSLTHAKSVLISPPDVAIDHLFPPYSKEKVQAINQWFDYEGK